MTHHLTDIELQEWLDSLSAVKSLEGSARAAYILGKLQSYAKNLGIESPAQIQTPYCNTLPAKLEDPYPGDKALEEKITNLIRWNALMMVVRANRLDSSLGGHLATFASSASLYEVGFNHFFKGPHHPNGKDQVFFQGHASPGIYARAFLEGRLSEHQLDHFRRESRGGVSSYPHPWLMPDFWEFPTVSMGLTSMMALYQARYQRYLENRGLKPKSLNRVWAFMGDGEMDEPESLGAITLAARENLNNLTFVVNCNLQRLDGPVRGNGKIIQELESLFAGAGWNVLKVIWSQDYDPLFDQDTTGAFLSRLGEIVDGQYQKYSVSTGAFVREDLCKGNPTLQKLLEPFTDEDLKNFRRGGHDIQKIFNAYKMATSSNKPSVVLVKTIKGFGLGKSSEGTNVTHQRKKLTDEELYAFRDRFSLDIPNETIENLNFFKPAPGSPEMDYLLEKRTALGGFLPTRKSVFTFPELSIEKSIEEFDVGSKERELSTTMAFVKLMTNLMKDPNIGKYIVPIVPDEARTFGMEALFNQFGIYAPFGQNYDPADQGSLLFYKESAQGQMLEEGITEGGAVSSFIAAGTAYATHSIPTIPFYIFYSMFGLQRVGDFIWAAADQRTKGFLIGATAGRTTLAGEGLQHQDGHSHLLALPVPNLKCYDPAFAFEVAVIVKEGIRRMYQNNESLFYYMTVANENYIHAPKPKNCEAGILKGLYLFQPSPAPSQVELLGSGSILMETLKAQKILKETFQIEANVWSVTSYKELYRDALEAERNALLYPDQKNDLPFISTQLSPYASNVCVATSDYVKALPLALAKWVPMPFTTLGTDGFGLSDTREALRAHFEVNAEMIVLASLTELCKQKKIPPQTVQKALTFFKLPAMKGKIHGLI